MLPQPIVTWAIDNAKMLAPHQVGRSRWVPMLMAVEVLITIEMVALLFGLAEAGARR